MMFEGGNLIRSDFDHLNFFKAQNSILYTLIISWKVSMTFKYQEYSIKMNMVQQLWTQFKMKFLLSYNMELVM